MRKSTTSASVCLKDGDGIEYRLCRLDYTVSEDGTYSYVFTPDYAVIDMLSPPLFQGIPGLDLDARRKEYVRRNMVPCFISERTPGENRQDVAELLEDAGMDHLNRLEWLIRTDLQYFGDNLYVVRYEEPKSVDMSGRTATFGSAAKAILREICTGNTVILDGVTIDDTNKTQIYFLLKDLRTADELAVKRMRKNGELPGLGRRRKTVSDRDLLEARERMKKGFMTAQQAADALGIGRATLFRKLKKMERDHPVPKKYGSDSR